MRIVSIASNSIGQQSQINRSQQSNPNFKCKLSGAIYDAADSAHLETYMRKIGAGVTKLMHCDVSTVKKNDRSVSLLFPKSPENIKFGEKLAGILNKRAAETGLEVTFEFHA